MDRRAFLKRGGAVAGTPAVRKRGTLATGPYSSRSAAGVAPAAGPSLQPTFPTYGKHTDGGTAAGVVAGDLGSAPER
jgi:hypothetical protein